MMIDLSLNNGTSCSPRCIEVLQSTQSITDLRRYSERENSELKAAAARECGVRASNIFLHNGSGPILKQYVPHVVRRSITASPWRMLKHLVKRDGYPLITAVPTYDKVLDGAQASGLTVRAIATSIENNFRLDPAKLEDAIRKGAGIVYLCNPNNPTGALQMDREQLLPLVRRFPDTTFLIDEAYVQYISPLRHRYLADLAAEFPNLACLRTLSFAYGLAAAHVGFLAAHEDVVARLEKQSTPYRIGALNEAVAVAALEDPSHLDYVRDRTADARRLLIEGIGRHPELNAVPSETNFILVQVAGRLTARAVAAALRQRGVLVRVFEPGKLCDLSAMFRVTTGTDEENQRFLEALDDVLSPGIAAAAAGGRVYPADSTNCLRS